MLTACQIEKTPTKISQGADEYGQTSAGHQDAGGRKYTIHLGAQTLADAGLPDDELQPG
ncbi:MAG: hypothetical protein R6U57_08460 [Anaerolineales bacterium]